MSFEVPSQKEGTLNAATSLSRSPKWRKFVLDILDAKHWHFHSKFPAWNGEGVYTDQWGRHVRQNVNYVHMLAVHRQLNRWPCLSLITHWVSHFWFLTLKSNPRDLWPLRLLIRVMRRHDLTQKYLTTYIPTHLPTNLPTFVPPLGNIPKDQS